MNLSRHDISIALRTLGRARSFTVASIGILALAIGAVVAVFSVVSAVLVRPLPYQQPDQLVNVFGNFPTLGLERIEVGSGEFFDYQSRTRAFRGFAAYRTRQATLGEPGASTPSLDAIEGSANLLSLLGATPIVGRLFAADDDLVGAPPKVLISAGLWRRSFGGSAAVVGTEIRVNGTMSRIEGVLPDGLKFPAIPGSTVPDVWLPLHFSVEDRTARGDRSLKVIARLKDGQSLASAQVDLTRVVSSFAADYPGMYPPTGAFVATLSSVRDEATRGLRTSLILVMGAVTLVLLLACANVANLLLTRATARRGEMAVRTALGADRRRIVELVLLENLLLSGCAAAGGLILAVGSLAIISRGGAGTLPWLRDISLDWRVILFTAVLTIATGLLCGIAPALAAFHMDIVGALRNGGAGVMGGRRYRHVRGLLSAAQVAIALVLLTGAGLLVRSFTVMMGEGAGIRLGGVASVEISAPGSRFSDNTMVLAFYENVFRSLGEIPGVERVSAVHVLPFSGSQNDRGFRVEGRDLGPNQPPPDEQARFVAPDYFATMGIPIISGRGIDRTDDANAVKRVVVSQSFARKIWPGESPLGKRIAFDGGNATPQWRLVVGVAGDVKHDALDQAAPPTFYAPLAQLQQAPRSIWIVLLAKGDNARLEQSVRERLSTLDPLQSSIALVSMTTRMQDATGPRRFAMKLLSSFSLLAFLLACVGLYALMAYAVSQRTREIGLRMALGSRPAATIALVMKEGVGIVGLGVLLGLLLGVPVMRLLRAQLYGIGPTDPTTLVVAGLGLTVAALLACYLPARAASRIDPLVAIRAS